ncbi:PEROXIDASE 72-RELATED [Salix viminalis]|uniref:peroxidase n=1 Tax=Salix viminalis TaxID=40686 RepID=A0A9Q0QKJ7_SALVM|nr:PEROXIDASE 72-RELATED [Salix viminalis]
MVSLGIFSLISTLFLVLAVPTTAASSKLSADYYDQVCPKALPAIKRAVEAAVSKERRMGASLLRLHFHDCFVNGCDASILLDSTSAFDSEKEAGPNNNSARGFEVIDRIKLEVDKDILAVAARDSVVVNFKKHGLDERDLVALSGGHTIGFAQCFAFRDRIYNETNIDPIFAQKRRLACPRTGGNSNLAALDPTNANFDAKYFSKLLKKRGLLHSDQELFNGGSTDSLVKAYSSDVKAFWADFAKSMVKMGNIKPLTGKKGQVRLNCRKAN